jgi:vacuolar protein sorting-associated protein 13A/C
MSQLCRPCKRPLYGSTTKVNTLKLGTAKSEISLTIEHGVIFIKYCSILLQALTIEADEDFLFAVYELAQFQAASWDNTQEESVLLIYYFGPFMLTGDERSRLIHAPDGIPEPHPARSGEDLYFEVFELQPIRLAISFMRTERVNSETRYVMIFYHNYSVC